MFLLQSLQAHLSVVKSFMFYLEISGDFAFLISQGTNSRIFGLEKMSFLFQSTMCGFFTFEELNHFSDCMISVQYISFIISGPKSFLILQISVAKIYIFL